MPHWRTLVKSEWFCAGDLWDDSIGEYARVAFKITKVTQGEVVGKKGRKKGLPFLWLEDKAGNPTRAPFGANPTNCTTIGTVLGTSDYAKWIGQWIGLYVTKVDGPDGMVDGIRIHPKPIEFKSGSAKTSAASDGEMSEDEKRLALERERKESGRG
jgi:hypothetical protein